MDFLTSEGRQDSEFEQEMAERLCNDLKEAKLDLVTKLMIVLFMSNFDRDDLGYGEFVGQDWMPTVLKTKKYKESSFILIHLVQVSFVKN